MKHLIKTVSFIAIMSVIPGAFGAASRASVRNQATSRVSSPSIAGYINARLLSYGSTTASSVMSNDSCISEYSSCIESDDACGADFTSCPDTVSFHANSTGCVDILTRCSPSGIVALFGPGATIGNLSHVRSWVKYDGGNTSNEVEEYDYPAQGGTLYVKMRNGYDKSRYDAATCKKKYERCLRKDNVCGEDFELCTSERSFSRQRVMCANVLSLCSLDGVKQLYGNDQGKIGGDCWKNGGTGCSATNSVLYDYIIAAAEKAADNASDTCYKVTDACILNACGYNPFRCIEGVKSNIISAAAALGGERTQDGNGNSVLYEHSSSTQGLISGSNKNLDDTYTLIQGTDESTKADIRKYIKHSCFETIGSNGYCYSTVTGKQVNAASPTAGMAMGKIYDLDTQEDVFDDLYATRRPILETKIRGLLEQFDTKAKDACSETIRKCAMNSCGGGIGSVCYSNSMKDNAIHVNHGKAYKAIKQSCAAVVNMDRNCQYAAAVSDDTAAYSYAYTTTGTEKTTFSVLFPEYDSTVKLPTPITPGGIIVGGSLPGGIFPIYNTGDPIGVIESLNAALASSYNPITIDNMRKQCEQVATSCIKSVCGKDYINCFRTRTDIKGDTYDSIVKNSVGMNLSAINKVTSGSSSAFDSSMNKQFGVLDYDIAIGLCVNNVKNAPACEEHLKIASQEFIDQLDWDDNDKSKSNNINAWKPDSDSVYSSWVDAAHGMSMKQIIKTDDIVTGCQTYKLENGKPDIGEDDECYRNHAFEIRPCGEMDEDDGCLFDKEKFENRTDYIINTSAKTLFGRVLESLNREAQAKYKTMINKQQQICMRNDSGGIRAANDNGGAFMWVKLSGNNIPKYYRTSGLKESDFVPSNDLYGSFCRVRVSVSSDDKNVNEILKKGGSDAYFATGDSFRCGSWISEKKMEDITKKIKEGAGTKYDTKSWRFITSMVATTVGGAGLGAMAGGLISEALSKGVGGISGQAYQTDVKKAHSEQTNAGSCVANLDKCLKGNKGYIRNL